MLISTGLTIEIITLTFGKDTGFLNKAPRYFAWVDLKVMNPWVGAP
jgi:hypothetical protein